MYNVHCTSQLQNFKYNNFTKENNKVDAWPWLYFYCDFFSSFFLSFFFLLLVLLLLVFYSRFAWFVVLCVCASLLRIRDHLMNFYRAIFNCNSDRDQFMGIRNYERIKKKWQWTWTTTHKQATISIEWKSNVWKEKMHTHTC